MTEAEGLTDAGEDTPTKIRPGSPIGFLTITLIFNCILLVLLGLNTYRTYQAGQLAERYTRIAELRGAIIHFDEVLTMSARMAVASGDLSWEDRYHQYDVQLDAALQEVNQLAPGAGGQSATKETEAANVKLIELEREAFDLVRRGRFEEAKSLLFSDEYEQQKQTYAHGMAALGAGLAQVVASGLNRQKTESVILVALAIISLPLLLWAWIAVFRVLRRWQTVLTENNHDLERRNKELDEFAYIASHDLQEPLRKITAFSGLLKMDLADTLPEDARENLTFLTDAAVRMQTLINDLMELSRSGRREMKREQISLDACVDAATDALSMQIEETGAEIQRDTLPHIWGDRTLLTQLLQNLLSNALKFQADGVTPNVRVTAERTDEGWIIGVKDNGIGIESQYAQQVFSPFKRLHGKDEYKGTGIGLAICRKAAERHGGRVWVESQAGNGSHFKFTI